jgi:hypothetical protein
MQREPDRQRIRNHPAIDNINAALGNEIERWFLVGRHAEAEDLIPGGDRLSAEYHRAYGLN